MIDHTTKRCGCGAPMVFARTRKGGKIPLDYPPVRLDELPLSQALRGPVTQGKFVLVAGSADFIAVGLAAVGGDLPADTAVWESHFSSCPNAAQHRRAS
jgi:hypothetical protein